MLQRRAGAESGARQLKLKLALRHPRAPVRDGTANRAGHGNCSSLPLRTACFSAAQRRPQAQAPLQQLVHPPLASNLVTFLNSVPFAR